MMRALIACLMLSGCAAVPYLDVGLGYQIDNNSDWYVRTERPWQGRNPQIHIEFGLEGKTFSCGYHHQSWLLSGGPLNHDPELYMDDFRCVHRFGGKK